MSQHYKFTFGESFRNDADDFHAPENVARREAVAKHLEASRSKRALERAKNDPATAAKIATLEHRRALATARAESLMERAACEGRTFWASEGRAFDEALAEKHLVERELRGLITHA